MQPLYLESKRNDFKFWLKRLEHICEGKQIQLAETQLPPGKWE